VPKRKVKVRFRRIWTVYYDRNDRGCVTSESFKTEQLAWNAIARVLRSWLKEDVYDNELESFAEVLRLLDAGNVEDARDLYAQLVEGPAANRVWIEQTRLVTSRTPL